MNMDNTDNTDNTDTDDKSRIISPNKFNFLKYTFNDVRKQIYYVYTSSTIPIAVPSLE